LIESMSFGEVEKAKTERTLESRVVGRLRDDFDLVVLVGGKGKLIWVDGGGGDLFGGAAAFGAVENGEAEETGFEERAIGEVEELGDRVDIEGFYLVGIKARKDDFGLGNASFHIWVVEDFDGVVDVLVPLGIVVDDVSTTLVGSGHVEAAGVSIR